MSFTSSGHAADILGREGDVLGAQGSTLGYFTPRFQGVVVPTLRSVQRDVGSQWAVLAPADVARSLSWAVHRALAASHEVRWAVRCRVDAEIDARWSQRVTVHAELSSAWEGGDWTEEHEEALLLGL